MGAKDKTTVYIDMEAMSDTENFSGFSFKNCEVEEMSFADEFLP